MRAAEYCPNCGAEVYWRYEGAAGKENIGVDAHSRVDYQWRECLFCNWQSERMMMVTTWASTSAPGYVAVYDGKGIDGKNR